MSVDTNILEEQTAVIFLSRPQCLHYEWAGNMGWFTGKGYGRNKVVEPCPGQWHSTTLYFYPSDVNWR